MGVCQALSCSLPEIGPALLDFPHADAVGICTVCNIAGNKCRLITEIKYRRQVVYLRAILTHEEHSRETWIQ